MRGPADRRPAAAPRSRVRAVPPDISPGVPAGAASTTSTSGRLAPGRSTASSRSALDCLLSTRVSPGRTTLGPHRNTSGSLQSAVCGASLCAGSASIAAVAMIRLMARKVCGGWIRQGTQRWCRVTARPRPRSADRQGARAARTSLAAGARSAPLRCPTAPGSRQ